MSYEEQQKINREIEHYLLRQAAIIVGIIFGAFILAKILRVLF